MTKYFYGLGLIKSESGSDEKFYHSDGLGSTRLLTDGTGQVTDRYVYDAFGRLIAHAGGSGNAYQFAGEQRDSTGLDYLRARYYNSDLGRFISKDAFAGHLASPISENAYVYANANPVNFTDPSGYESLGELSAAEAIVGVLSSIPYASIGQGILGGALFGLAYGLIKQDAELLEGRRSEVSWNEVFQSTYLGAAFGGLFANFPLAGAAFAAAGAASAINEARNKHFLSAAVDLAFALGPLASKEGSEPILKEIEGILSRNNVKVSINKNSSESLTISLPEGEVEVLSTTDGLVTIYKAPQLGMSDKLLNEGFQPEEFFDPDGDNLAYFAKERELAEIYEKFYRDGILEVDIPKDVYDARIKQYETPYQGGPLTEIPIPQEHFDVLNNANRRLVR